MGVYLSSANRDATYDEGNGNLFNYVAGSVQGWRKNMEDAHIAECDLRAKIKMGGSGDAMSLFSVFDGHGGKEVAMFCEKHFCDELASLSSFKAGDYERALTECFHRMDVLLEDKSNEKELRKYRKVLNPSEIVSGSHKSDGTGMGKKRVNEKEAIEVFRRLLEQEQNKKMGIESKPAPPLASSSGYYDDHDSDDEDIPLDEIEDYVAKPGPPSVCMGEGQFVCNLADHRVSAGCTSVVVLRVGNKLICANAGDSRAVLARKGGEVFAMSEDHKPSQDVERNRIEAAGGFISNVGRVNGNLNLTRSLGDLKYKQVSGVLKADQIITSEPDIVSADLRPDDEFLILGCDGIWDCLSNQDAVDFVRARLVKGMSMKDIVSQVFDYCISEDPRKTSGIGGDNMTFILVKLPGCVRKDEHDEKD